MLTKWVEDKSLLRGALDFIFPPLCTGCGTYEPSSSFICKECLNRIQRFEKPICLNCEAEMSISSGCSNCGEKQFPLFAYGCYRPVLNEIIIQYKFKNVKNPIDFLVPLLFEKFNCDLKKLKLSALVPIPLHPLREYQRGYNQALIIAEILSSLSEIKVSTDLIYRIKRRKPQAKLDFKRRKRNIRGVFRVDDRHTNKENILLVDDVVTTGATVNEAKKMLEIAGHKVAGVVTLAHGK